MDFTMCDTIRDFRNVLNFCEANLIEINQADITKKLFQAYINNFDFDKRNIYVKQVDNEVPVVLDGVVCHVRK